MTITSIVFSVQRLSNLKNSSCSEKKFPFPYHTTLLKPFFQMLQEFTFANGLYKKCHKCLQFLFEWETKINIFFLSLE